MVKHSDDICKESAKLLAEGYIFGWFQDRSEYGPRALGNRSILADPRKPEIKDKLNRQVKFRQAFRPFAPIVLLERVGEIFEGEDELPFMLRAKNVKPAWRDRIAGIVHVDGTARVQTLREDTNPKLYRLLEGVRGSHRRAGAGQHLVQRQGRADRRDPAGCHELLPEYRHRLPRAARHADLEEPLARLLMPFRAIGSQMSVIVKTGLEADAAIHNKPG